jgi:hypothetical protein
LFLIVWQICNILDKTSALPDCDWNSFNKTRISLIIWKECSAETIDVDFLGDQSGTKAKNNNLIELTIQHAGLKTIQANTFNTAYNMKNLNLNFNEISVLEEKAFNGLPNLIKLNLYQNKIATLHAKIFYELIALIKLDLDSNKLSTFKFSILKNSLNLEYFDARNNVIEKIETTDFANSKLETIDLSNNSLSTFPLHNLKVLPNLNYLDISSNNFTEFQFIELGIKLLNLKEIYFRNNPWECYYIFIMIKKIKELIPRIVTDYDAYDIENQSKFENQSNCIKDCKGTIEKYLKNEKKLNETFQLNLQINCIKFQIHAIFLAIVFSIILSLIIGFICSFINCCGFICLFNNCCGFICLFINCCGLIKKKRRPKWCGLIVSPKINTKEVPEVVNPENLECGILSIPNITENIVEPKNQWMVWNG